MQRAPPDRATRRALGGAPARSGLLENHAKNQDYEKSRSDFSKTVDGKRIWRFFKNRQIFGPLFATKLVAKSTSKWPSRKSWFAKIAIFGPKNIPFASAIFGVKNRKNYDFWPKNQKSAEAKAKIFTKIFKFCPAKFENWRFFARSEKSPPALPGQLIENFPKIFKIFWKFLKIFNLLSRQAR